MNRRLNVFKQVREESLIFFRVLSHKVAILEPANGLHETEVRPYDDVIGMLLGVFLRPYPSVRTKIQHVSRLGNRSPVKRPSQHLVPHRVLQVQPVLLDGVVGKRVHAIFIVLLRYPVFLDGIWGLG